MNPSLIIGIAVQGGVILTMLIVTVRNWKHIKAEF